MSNRGIDYGMGLTNIDHETGEEYADWAALRAAIRKAEGSAE